MIIYKLIVIVLLLLILQNSTKTNIMWSRRSLKWPVPLTALSKAWVCGRSLAGIAGSNPAGVMGVSVVSVVCCLRLADHSYRGVLPRSLCVI